MTKDKELILDLEEEEELLPEPVSPPMPGYMYAIWHQRNAQHVVGPMDNEKFLEWVKTNPDINWANDEIVGVMVTDPAHVFPVLPD